MEWGEMGAGSVETANSKKRRRMKVFGKGYIGIGTEHGWQFGCEWT
jgi:hypothetical protein